eukprot:2293770-Amphidinium_carterae.1
MCIRDRGTAKDFIKGWPSPALLTGAELQAALTQSFQVNNSAKQCVKQLVQSYQARLITLPFCPQLSAFPPSLTCPYLCQCFNLVSVVAHAGAHEGHYIASVLKEGQWWLCNDAVSIALPFFPSRLLSNLTFVFVQRLSRGGGGVANTPTKRRKQQNEEH